MAGKSNKGKNRKALHSSGTNYSEQVVSSDVPVGAGSSSLEVNGDKNLSESNGTTSEVKGENNESQQHSPNEEIQLYPVSVKTHGGEKLELQLSPSDTVVDIRQFLIDAPETCFVTCYEMLLHKDGSVYPLEDQNEISEVADITSGSCHLEMVPALYDDQSIRFHLHRMRQLLLPLHSSLSSALQHETSRKASANHGDAVKVEVPELDNLSFLESNTSLLSSLLPSPSKEIKCVESVVFSSFNPPPSYRRLSGDLIYLDIVTLEGNKYCVTGTTKSFYVNSSLGDILDPKPNKAASEATTLVGLLQKISPKFKKAFREILERKVSAHPFESVQTPLSPNAWLATYPVPDHKRDAARAETSLRLSFGSELIGMQRDWNEELQACREFPHDTQQDRILRDRALYKVSTDFVDAAVSGAMGVISRCIPPINPTDPERFHMYVHNNIFFSFAVDSELEQLYPKKTSEEKVEATVTSHDSYETENGQSLGASGVSDSNGSSVIDKNNANANESSAPDMPLENQLAETEQATYASSNNDLKGTKAFQEADVPGLYNLAMTIIDFRGYRVVAQSVLPGILQGDKTDSILYGSVDNGKKVCWSEDFHSKVLVAAKHLHIKEHTVLDGSGNEFKLAAAVESKGIAGSDERHYLLDLMRVTPRDANYTGPGSKCCILRPELIAAFIHAKAAEKPNTGCESGENFAASDSLGASNAEEPMTEGKHAPSTTQDTACKLKECGSHSDANSQMLFNPNVFTDCKLAGSPEEIATDEENVRKASLYLKDVVIPKFIHDLSILDVSPMDGQTLTEAFHVHGINIRYIGKIAEGTRHMPHLWDLFSNEIVVRSAKHIVKVILRDTEDHDLGLAISHFFNCFLGKVEAVSAKGAAKSTLSKTHKKVNSGHDVSGKFSKGQAKLRHGVHLRKKQFLYLSITSESLWIDIKEFAKLKYQFELPEDAGNRVKKISVIRNLCQKVGITIAGRKYDFNAVAPFQGSDILNIQPVVKHSIPVCSDAKNMIETGKVQLAEGKLNEAFTLFSEALAILQQVTGPMYREVANCCRYLAMVLYHAGDIPGAISHQHKELIINERCLGLDHPDTAHSYGNLALFFHGLNQAELALRHMSRALLLLSLSSGPDHPDVAATYINVAMMFQDTERMDSALRYLQEALKTNERLLGEEHIQTAVCYHALAVAFNSMGAFKLSYQHEKKTYDILVKQLGEEDSRTKDSLNWMKTFKMRDLQKGQTVNATSTQKAIDILKAHPDLIQAFQAAAVAGGSGASANKSFNNAVIGDALPRGRGVDERAAKAAAEMRKKAAARGLTLRPHGVPVQAVPSITQLLKLINSGATQDAVTNEAPIPAQQDQAPVVTPSLDANEVKTESNEGLNSEARSDSH